ncbi:MAG: hypothetical protein JNK82_12910 [Myxococcaceae bacterium]|nr:hypothetical protein [Myxococcaceae bacterium]
MKRIVLVLSLLSCTSNEYREGLLKLRWSPPAGVELQSEATEGAVTVARFSGGVEVRSVAEQAKAATGDLDALRTSLIAGGKLGELGEVKSARTSSIRTGPVVQWELQSASNRAQLYYVPGVGRYVLISLVGSGSGSDFNHRSDKLQLSLSTLSLR